MPAPRLIGNPLPTTTIWARVTAHPSESLTGPLSRTQKKQMEGRDRDQKRPLLTEGRRRLMTTRVGSPSSNASGNACYDYTPGQTFSSSPGNCTHKDVPRYGRACASLDWHATQTPSRTRGIRTAYLPSESLCAVEASQCRGTLFRRPHRTMTLAGEGSNACAAGVRT